MSEAKRELPGAVKAALIDMDGVLYDSMPYHSRAWYRMLKEQGIETDPDEFFLYEGMTGADTINLIFKREKGREATESEKRDLYRRKAELFVEAGEKKMMPGALRMLQALKRMNLETILVTGSAQGSLLESLEKDYTGYFPKERRVTALDVKNGKPHPEPYLKGAEKAGVKPSEAIVIENAPLGVRAGKAAGCFTIAVTTGPIPREKFEEEGADMIFSSMDEFADWMEGRSRLSLSAELDCMVKALRPASVTVVTDENVNREVLPVLFADSEIVNGSRRVVLKPGEANKNIKSVESIWNVLEISGATRNSLIVNIGGGMITDIGGFAAATFKRGIRYLNVPTTLLGAVDAASGGKTGVNFNGLKNEIGAFHQPSGVMISSLPLKSLAHEEIISGFAEMVKTGLIADEGLYHELMLTENITGCPGVLEQQMKKCVEIKNEIVASDPTEKGLRKVLNFGHTAGHAFESLSFKRERPLAHGVAVAHGMLVELILSHMILGFDSLEVKRYTDNILKSHYPLSGFSCKNIDELIALMEHDKKNSIAGKPNFTLLQSIGNPVTDCLPDISEISTALEIYMDYTC